MKNITYLLVVITFTFSACKKKKLLKNVDFRSEMVQFVAEISAYAKSKNPDFLIIPQNGEALAGEQGYLNVVDGLGREDLSYGYDGDGKATNSADKNEMVNYLDMFVNAGKTVLTTDYVFSNSEDVPDYNEASNKISTAYNFSISKGYVPYATVRNLNYITINPFFEPDIDVINSFSDVTEFLYYLQPKSGTSKTEYINSISQTNFDCVIMDYSFDGTDKFSTTEISTIKQGLNNGNGGLTLAYMSIGEAENYRFYWDDKWTTKGGRIKHNAPDWLYKEDSNWKGNFYVLYWKQEWKDIIFTYLDEIIAQGFDGVYLDIIDAFEFYEDVMGQ